MWRLPVLLVLLPFLLLYLAVAGVLSIIAFLLVRPCRRVTVSVFFGWFLLLLHIAPWSPGTSAHPRAHCVGDTRLIDCLPDFVPSSVPAAGGGSFRADSENASDSATLPARSAVHVLPCLALLISRISF